MTSLTVLLAVALATQINALPYTLVGQPSVDPQWYLANANPGALTFSTAVGFADANKGYLAGGANGIGAEVLRTTDGGLNFTTVQGINFGLDLLLLAAEAKGNTVIVTSIFGEMYSIDDGRTFHHSIGGGLSQSVRYIGGLGAGDALHFGVAGQTLGGRNQVALTSNGGITFKAFPTNQFTSPRYAAWPSDDVWYSAAGSFPSNPPPPPQAPAMRGPRGSRGQGESVQPREGRPRRFRKSAMQDADGYWNTEAWKAMPQEKDGYQAQISKTIDGGKTWVSQFESNGTYYFNEIDCAPGSTTNCCAAAECGNNGPTAGGYVICTTDGETWKEAWHEPSTPGKQSVSLMGLEFSSPTEAWACGGIIKQFGIQALFLHSTDAGATWKQVDAHPDTKNHVCLGLDMLSTKSGYAALDNVATQSSGLGKFGTGTPPAPPAPPTPPVPPPPGMFHYGDPDGANGCLKDEKSIQITGLSGSFCSPSCGLFIKCPTDVPAGTTATPACALETPGSSFATQCALECKPSGDAGQCPDKASCKAIQSVGLCTYDA